MNFLQELFQKKNMLKFGAGSGDDFPHIYLFILVPSKKRNIEPIVDASKKQRIQENMDVDVDESYIAVASQSTDAFTQPLVCRGITAIEPDPF